MSDQWQSEIQNSKTKIQNPTFPVVVAGLAIFLTALDQTVVVTALWPISTDLQIPVTELDRAAWVVTAYLLGYTVALPLMGRVADVYGQRTIFFVALGIFTLGSVLCALSPSLEWLIGARFLQAMGGGAVLPVGMAMVSHLFSDKRIPFMLGLLAAIAEAGGVIGPLWGAMVMKMGGFLDIVGWRWIFWVNVPLCLLLGFLMLRMPALPRYPGKIDWPGAFLLGGALFALSLALSTPGSVGAWAGLDTQPGANNPDTANLLTPLSAGLFVVALLLLFAFAWWQRHSSDPLLPPTLFSTQKWPFVAANLTNFLVGAALIITMVNTPLYVVSVLDGNTEQGGLMLLRMTAFIPVGALLGGVLGTRTPYRWIGMVGLLVTAAGFWLMAGWTTLSADYPQTWLGLALNGTGFGLLLAPVTATALQWAGRGHAALSAASVNLSRMVGMMLSLSALTVVGLRHFQSRMASHPAVIFANPGETAEAFAARQAEYTAVYKAVSLEVFTGGFFIAGLICLLAITVVIWLKRNPASDVEAGPVF